MMNDQQFAFPVKVSMSVAIWIDNECGVTIGFYMAANYHYFFTERQFFETLSFLCDDTKLVLIWNQLWALDDNSPQCSYFLLVPSGLPLVCIDVS